MVVSSQFFVGQLLYGEQRLRAVQPLSGKIAMYRRHAAQNRGPSAPASQRGGPRHSVLGEEVLFEACLPEKNPLPKTL